MSDTDTILSIDYILSHYYCWFQCNMCIYVYIRSATTRVHPNINKCQSKQIPLVGTRSSKTQSQSKKTKECFNGNVIVQTLSQSKKMLATLERAPNAHHKTIWHGRLQYLSPMNTSMDRIMPSATFFSSPPKYHFLFLFQWARKCYEIYISARDKARIDVICKL